MKAKKIIEEMKLELLELKKMNKENKELNEILKAQTIDNEQMLKSFFKKIPDGMFS